MPFPVASDTALLIKAAVDSRKNPSTSFVTTVSAHQQTKTTSGKREFVKPAMALLGLAGNYRLKTESGDRVAKSTMV